MNDPFGSRRKNGRFVNIGGAEPRGFSSLLKWALNRNQGFWEEPGGEYNFADPPPERVQGDDVRITFVGHATVLIQGAGLNILTDPIFADRASPLSWAGPVRVRPPGIRFDDLPPIDVVLISHNHYDHMCRATLERLADRDAPLVVTPLGNAAVPRAAQLARIAELDWWQTDDQVPGLHVTCVPAQHFSARGLFDRRKALWGGFYLRIASRTVYFAGDTAWADFFAEIRCRLGAPDVAMIPIGAYRPRFIMKPVHVTPAEAVDIHRVVGARRSMAIHFGTFPLADDGQFEPIEDLHVALDEAAVPRSDFRAPAHGEAWVIGRDGA